MVKKKDEKIYDSHKIIITYEFKKNKDNSITEFILVQNKNGHTIKKFKRNDRLKNIKNFKTQVSGNEEAIRNYFQKRFEKSGGKYKPTDSKYIKYSVSKQINKNETEKKDKIIKNLINGNQYIFSNKQSFKKSKYNFVYVSVKVKIWFNGIWLYNWGKGDNFHKEDYPKGIPKKKLREQIIKGIRWALAPYGSDLKFELISWQYIYHRRKYEDFESLNQSQTRQEEKQVFTSQFK